MADPAALMLMPGHRAAFERIDNGDEACAICLSCPATVAVWLLDGLELAVPRAYPTCSAELCGWQAVALLDSEAGRGR